MVIVKRIRASDPHGLNKGCGLKFPVGSQVQQETPEEGWRTYLVKREYNTKYEDNRPKTLNDKNHQASSKKFRQQKVNSCIRNINNNEISQIAFDSFK